MNTNHPNTKLRYPKTPNQPSPPQKPPKKAPRTKRQRAYLCYEEDVQRYAGVYHGRLSIAGFGEIYKDKFGTYRMPIADYVDVAEDSKALDELKESIFGPSKTSFVRQPVDDYEPTEFGFKFKRQDRIYYRRYFRHYRGSSAFVDTAYPVFEREVASYGMADGSTPLKQLLRLLAGERFERFGRLLLCRSRQPRHYQTYALHEEVAALINGDRI